MAIPPPPDKVLGVMILTRHGDREGFYQDPLTYTPSFTTITPLGTVQLFQLGQQLRSMYLDPVSSLVIADVNSDLVDQTQLHVRADSGGEGGVIYDSTVALLQGLFPANPNFNTTLASGQLVQGALGGYQYVPIQTVDPSNEVSLEGWTNCATFDAATQAFYNSPEFLQKANESAHFLSLLPPFLDGRPATLVSMWNVYDFMAVNGVHNASFAERLPPTFLEQARDLANFHQRGVFTSPQLDGIGNITGRTILPGILQDLQAIADPKNPLKIAYQSISYKPFLSIFNMTGAAEQNPGLSNIVNFAAAALLEVRQPASGGPPVLRLKFKNGTDEAEFTTYDFLGRTGDVSLGDVIDSVNPALINSTAAWCAVCENTKDRGCAALASHVAKRDAGLADSAGVLNLKSKQFMENGFLGVGLTMSVNLALFGILMFFGFISVGKGRHSRAGSN
ncbi:histidine phosphatase superfamily [Roridomyces roridus]|uniref:Histidine phosphatase superfamily n=1 Tax=Roridomyces roridus TaxID=1738132 RepID=A0AAD7FC47_9AGAR|nr:histidine phosphatase superfamily [Roridomyces roridus]